MTSYLIMLIAPLNNHCSWLYLNRYIKSERSIILINFCLSIISSNILILVGQTQVHNKVRQILNSQMGWNNSMCEGLPHIAMTFWLTVYNCYGLWSCFATLILWYLELMFSSAYTVEIEWFLLVAYLKCKKKKYFSCC